MADKEKPSSAPSLAPLPPGFRYAYNRLATPFWQQFAGIPEAFEPHETKILETERAEFFHKQFLIPGTLRRGERDGMLQAEHQIVLDGDAAFQVPYEGPVGAELFSPDLDNYVERGTGGLKTTRKLVRI